MDTTHSRDISIDRIRGISVFVMVFFQYAKRFDSLDLLSRFANHNIDKGIVLLKNQMTLADIGAPAFFFFIALTFFDSFKRRLNKCNGCRKEVYGYFAKRYLLICGLGFLFTGSSLFFRVLVKHEHKYNPVFYPAFVVSCIAVILILACVVLYLLKEKEKFSKAKKFAEASFIALALLNYVQAFYFDYVNIILKIEMKCSWDVLQTIATVGLLTLPFAQKSTKQRSIAAVCFFAFYYFIFSLEGMPEILDVPAFGGLTGSIAWSVFFLAFSVISDLYKFDNEHKSHRYWIAVGIFAVLGLIGYLFMPICKGNVSPGYILFNLAICPVVFKFVRLFRNKQFKYEFLIWWGISPMLMFVVQYLLNDIVFSLFDSLEKLPKIPAVIFMVCVTALFSFIGYRTYKSKNPQYS